MARPAFFAWQALRSAGSIQVTIEGALPAKGGLIINLFDEASYLDTPVMNTYISIPENGTAITMLEDVPTGTYALAVIHDKNGNKKMDTNFLGIPKEKGGFSNNAPAKFGPAKFDKAAFEVGESVVIQTIVLRKAK